MNRLIVTTLGVFLFSISITAHAGKESHGGNLVVCRDTTGKVTSAELLDYYEARITRGILVDLGASSLSVSEKIRLALYRFDGISSERTKRFWDQANSFQSEALFLTGVVFPSIPDYGQVYYPKGCGIEQAVIQKKPEFPQDRLYTINQDLWDLLDSNNQAGLVLHEIIYREAISVGQTTSIKTRYFNSILSSKSGVPDTDKKLYDLLTLVQFTSFDARQKHFGLSPTTLFEFFPDGGLEKVSSDTLFPIDIFDLKNAQLIVFYPSGSVSEFLGDSQNGSWYQMPNEGHTVFMGGNIDGGPFPNSFYQGLKFYENGQLAWGRPKSGDLTFTLDGHVYHLPKNGFVSFTETGSIISQEFPPFTNGFIYYPVELVGKENGSVMSALEYFTAAKTDFIQRKTVFSFSGAGAFVVRNQAIPVIGTNCEFDLQGNPMRLDVPADTPLKLESGTEVHATGSIQFYTSGVFQSLTLSRDVRLTTVYAGRRTFAKGTMLSFNTEGGVLNE